MELLKKSLDIKKNTNLYLFNFEENLTENFLSSYIIDLFYSSVDV